MCFASFLTPSVRAEVIKIEHPVRGDDTRAWGPPYAKYGPKSELSGPGEAAYFLGVSGRLTVVWAPIDPLTPGEF